MHDIKPICDQLGLKPRTCIEVGAAHPYTYRLAPFLETSKVVLVEANPRLHYCLSVGWDEGDFQKTWPTVSALPHEHPPVAGRRLDVVHAAIVDVKPADGVVRFYEVNASSYVAGVSSPARQNDGFQETSDKRSYEVPALTIDELDDGEVDLLLSDTEGSEWFCVKYLKSRPRLIVLELWGNRYVNPFIKEIADWMSSNGYAFVGRDETDGVFVRPI